jgi:hypothetical protein
MLTLLLALTRLAGGEITGDLRSGDQYLSDVPVKLTCATDTVEARTDKSGSFRLRSKEAGKCRLAVTWKDQSSAVDVVVFDKPTRYRLVAELVNGKLVLKRV